VRNSPRGSLERHLPQPVATEEQLYAMRRGENAMAERRAELRKLAYAQITEAEQRARVQIERISVEAQTKILETGLSAPAQEFLKLLPSVDTLMPPLQLERVEQLRIASRPSLSLSHRVQARHQTTGRALLGRTSNFRSGAGMARRKQKTAGVPTVYRQDDGIRRPVPNNKLDDRAIRHRTVNTLGLMLRAGTITGDMHDAARAFQVWFTIAHFDASAAHRYCGSQAEEARWILPTPRLTRAAVLVLSSTRSVVSAVPPAAACGISSVCSARSARGRCGRGGAEG
jgi:hypothetical protein